MLKGATVYYSSYNSIADALKYDFEQEQGFSYARLPNEDVARHFAKFVSGVWQVHPFGEGNTRTTAVFAILYLRSMGYAVDNDPFKEHSWYFRNALVRANYEDVTRGIEPASIYLERFFENLLCGAHHDLRNRYLHLDWPQRQSAQETTQERSGTTQETTQEHSGTTQETTQEKLLALLRERPTITARQLATELGISFDGVRYHLGQLRKAGRIRHEGPTKGGRWVVDDRN